MLLIKPSLKCMYLNNIYVLYSLSYIFSSVKKIDNKVIQVEGEIYWLFGFFV